jgi:predicted HicB family RNase H-like nuclease
VVFKWLMASRRAYADEYAVRVNRAVELLVALSSADAVRGLQAEFELSERQARRYVNAALERPEGVVVPERTAVFTVRLAPSVVAGLRERARVSGQSLSATVAEAARLYLDHVHERHGGKAR